MHRQTAAETETETSQSLRSRSGPPVPNHLTTDMRLIEDGKPFKVIGTPLYRVPQAMMLSLSVV